MTLLWCSIGLILWVGFALFVLSLLRAAANADAHIEAMKYLNYISGADPEDPRD
jgi:hypothetical protein